MATITITKQELKSTIRESVREVLAEEMMHLRALLIPYISDEEQEDIKRVHGKPTRKSVKSIKIRV